MFAALLMFDLVIRADAGFMSDTHSRPEQVSLDSLAICPHTKILVGGEKHHNVCVCVWGYSHPYFNSSMDDCNYWNLADVKSFGITFIGARLFLPTVTLTWFLVYLYFIVSVDNTSWCFVYLSKRFYCLPTTKTFLVTYEMVRTLLEIFFMCPKETEKKNVLV